MKHFYLLRHGQSEANADKIVAGSQDSPLSELGRLQSKLAGQNAKQFYHFDCIVTSPLRRAHETATIIAHEIRLPEDKVIILENLRERDLGELEGVSYTLAPHHNGNYEDAENAPGIEPIEAFFHRAEHAMKLLQALPDATILIITHNGLGRMLRTVCENGKPLELYKQARLENAIIYHLASVHEN